MIICGLNQCRTGELSDMRSLAIPAAAILILAIACASIMGKWGEGKIDSLSEECLAENDALKPSTAKWYNLSTQERVKKKREMEQYKKKRIDLYQALDSYKKLYTAHAAGNGKCKVKECAPLAKLRREIVEGCPVAGASFPVTE